MNGDADQVTLGWPAAAGAVRYRVLVHADGTRLLDLEADEPSLRLARSELSAVRRWTWQVLVRRAEDGGWEDYLPRLLGPDEQLSREPQLAWPVLPEVLAYRVVVRDETVGEVVLKDGFLKPPGSIDWSRLDIRHVHRAQVQAWLDGAWRHHVPYRTVFPPTARVAGEVLELSWAVEPGERLYRVVVRPWSGEALVDTVARRPPIRLPASWLPAGVRFRWQVHVLGEDEPYTPEMVLGLEQQPELRFREVAPARAYRLLVYEGEADALVLKDAFPRPPGRVDWSRLDVSRAHGVRVQAWIDGRWRSHQPYRRLFPPPERILPAAAPQPHGDRASASGERLRHLVVVRFPGRSPDSIYAVRLPDALHMLRLSLFETWTLPSLGQLAGLGVEWSLVCDNEVPDAVCARLLGLCGERLLDRSEERARLLEPGGQCVAVATVLAGDAVHPALPAAVARQVGRLSDQHSAPFAVGFPLFVEASPQLTKARLVIDRGQAPFAVYIAAPASSVDLADFRNPLTRLARRDHQASDWSVPALLRARPGPNQHPLFMHLHGPDVAPELVSVFGAGPRNPAGAAAAAMAASGRE